MSTPVVTPDSAPATDHGHLISTDPTWRKTGLMPESKPSEAAPAPAPVAEQESESAAASEAAPPQEPKPKRSDANTRIRDLIAQNKRLEAQLDEARRPRDAKPAESSPAKEVEAPKALQAPVKPNPADAKYSGAKGWELLEADRDKYYDELSDYKIAKAKADFAREMQWQQESSKLQNDIAEGEKRYPDLRKTIKPLVDGLMDPKASIAPKVIEQINDSPVMADLLYVIAGDAGSMQEFIELARANPTKAIRQIGVIEQMIGEELTGAKEETTAPEKKVPVTPKPVSEVSGKGTAPPDEVQQAAEASAQSEGNPRAFAKYREAKNRAELLKRKGK